MSQNHPYFEYIYQWAGFMRYLPFSYKATRNQPDALVPVKCQTQYTRFASVSSLVVCLFIVSTYFEAFFGSTTRFEFLFIIGINSVFNSMLITQVYILLPTTRQDYIYVMNAALNLRFNHCLTSPPPYKIMCVLLTLCSTLYWYSFMYLPLIFAASVYIPGIFGTLNYWISSIVISFKFEAVVATLLIHTLRLSIFIIIFSIALAQGVSNLVVVMHWICMYYYTTVQCLEKMLRRQQW